MRVPRRKKKKIKRILEGIYGFRIYFERGSYVFEDETLEGLFVRKR